MAETASPHRTSDFDFDLPPDLIAQVPSARRGKSRLLVVRRDATESRRFGDLVDLVPAGDVLVLNTTRVRHARFQGTRPSGRPVEVLLLHPGTDDTWVAMGTPGGALRPGKRIRLGEGIEIEVIAVVAEGYRVVRFHGATAEESMRRFGRLPLPPYIRREPTPSDDERYQTVYAERAGSVAAPTAGLHFTGELLAALERKGVHIVRLDLEVGPGTFRPVETEEIAAHPMHPERFEVPADTARKIATARERGAKVWAVGTTVVRALESAAGADRTVNPGPGETRLLITPGYRFRVVDHLVTNFHLPRSTLLMLVAAFAGYDRTMASYRRAVAEGFRFYSYGDAMVIV